jgi:hypothetical protein
MPIRLIGNGKVTLSGSVVDSSATSLENRMVLLLRAENWHIGFQRRFRHTGGLAYRWCSPAITKLLL